MTTKPTLSYWQIWNMSFGFLGIQFGFALQNANVSRIFETLGAKVENIPILWIAAPVTGLLVQPIVGYLSDRTWNRLGRRRPYFLTGAILASLALLVMPNSPALWVAAGMLWIMDASINISMEPFRAFVGDNLPAAQRVTGFAMQSFFIGTGAVVASALPWILTNLFGVKNEAAAGQIPESVRLSFYLGAAVFFCAVLWTVFRSREYSPEQMASFAENRAREDGRQGSDNRNALITILKDFLDMPRTMRQLAWAQFFSWFALFAMWIYTTVGVTSHVYGTSDTTSALYNQGANWVGICFAFYSLVAAVVAFAIPPLARWSSPKTAHIICLVCGALGLASIYFITSPKYLLGSMVGVGIAWASILSMPYAILTGSLPPSKLGYYMGVFNFFIVIPQIVAAAVLGFIVGHFFHHEAIFALLIGGGSLLLAAALMLRVKDE
ncbi:MAG TPA: MFS transporter [Gemmatimonadales bacterium]|nr:MFS transporter [Gemmatimonadales bacterium]